MPWFKVDSHFDSHPAVWKAGDAAMGLWLRLGCWLANFPDEGDYISRPTMQRMAGRRSAQVRRLVDAHLLIEVEGGYQLNRSMAICSSGLPGPSWQIETGRTRAAIPASLRAAVYDRDGRACVECGATEDLTVDNIWPWSLGGEDTLENLRTLCRPCNSRKGARV